MDKHINILGVDFTNISARELVNSLQERIIHNKKTFIVTANPEIVMHTLSDKHYKFILKQANYVIADGIGVVKAAAMLKRPLPERIPGYELMIELLKIGNEKKLKVFLLGSQEGVLEKTVINIQEKFPNIKIAGYHNGFFDWENNDIKEQIMESSPDIILVALGVPRQERWISENIGAFRKGIFIGVGGSFDVLAGTVKRAPELWQRLNIEWLYRLIQQPWRWKRMLVLPLFVIKVFQQKLNLRKY
ncbi:WecB/TagA/CpsF family glycosyltransferase [Fredinandcohnia onubensis]|uniref:WecB/TagA/CpsF family glycosyltransferase n=1 Tax=Fredinandcohnia onubensis TaxID=1571209 RepID=UPI000C0BD1BE|nr:WecB/TagA/CpsF family glycosyltransferase [Fredinandcohnia onubensis]